MTGNLCTPGTPNSTALNDWTSIINGAQAAVDTAGNAVKKVASSAADSVKAAAIEGAQVYAINHPQQTKFAVASTVLVFTGAIAGLLALGYIVAQQNK